MADDVNKDLRVILEREYPTVRLGNDKRWEFQDIKFELAKFFKSLFVNKLGSWTVLDIKDLEFKYFLDILNPSENELVLFELEYGFEWPFQKKNKTINSVGLTDGETLFPPQQSCKKE